MVEWGQRGILECAKILDQLKAPLPDEAEDMARGEDTDLVGSEETAQTHTKPVSTAPIEVVEIDAETGLEELTNPESRLSEPPDLDGEGDEPASKRQKEMTLEEYEAMLDAENGPGGFLEGGDIANSVHQDP